MPRDLRQEANELEARIKAGRPGRDRDRQLILGRLVTSGRLRIPMAAVHYLQEDSDLTDSQRRQVSVGMLEQHGYRTKVRDGKSMLRGPSEYPEGPAPFPGSVIPDGGAATSTGGGGGEGSSMADARQELQVRRDYEKWSTYVRRRDIWEGCQEDRALVFGQVLLMNTIQKADVRKFVQQNLSGTDAELWSDAELRADYPASAAALGEGA